MPRLSHVFFAAAAVSLPLSGAASAAETLTVYTYDSFVSDWGPGPQIEANFEAVCGCDLEFVSAGDGAALLGRLKLEGKRSRADIVLGLDANLAADAAATGLFAPHGLTPETDVPGGWADPHFLPYDWGWFAFVYDKTRLATPPASFEELLAAPDDVTIVIQDPRSSTPGLGLLLWVKQIYGDEAGAVWERLAPRIVTVTKGWSEAYGMFLQGEAAMALSYTTSPAYHVIAEDDRTKAAAIFSEGHYLQVEIAGKLASTKQNALADQFLAFMLSDGFQSAIPETNWMYPAKTPSSGLPEEIAALPVPAKTLIYPVSDAKAARDAALTEWLEALSR
ncbi:thiamine ABC transporter substrate binding subunit [Pikeienuella sp. HZG-20]|uniref:thiamine ABC transporter substrate binding subunit n=1 Tax=Paludibacillus litoralis TaxID=3133267 RepID=UPI0030EEAC88